LVKTTYL